MSIGHMDNKPYCCHIGCNNDATVIIQGQGGFEDYTHMCDEHKDEYTLEGDTVIELNVR